MFNISATELLVIAVVALLVLGPDKLPDAMRKLGRATREIRRVTSGFEAELRDALSDPIETPTPPPAPPSSDGLTPTSSDASAPLAPANPTAVPEPAPSVPDVPGEQASSGETAA